MAGQRSKKRRLWSVKIAGASTFALRANLSLSLLRYLSLLVFLPVFHYSFSPSSLFAYSSTYSLPSFNPVGQGAGQEKVGAF